MHVDVTTTVSLKDDNGREVSRSITKARSTNFTLEDDTAQTHQRIARALERAKKLAVDLPDLVLGALRS